MDYTALFFRQNAVALLLPLIFTCSGPNIRIGLQRGSISDGLFAILVIMSAPGATGRSRKRA